MVVKETKASSASSPTKHGQQFYAVAKGFVPGIYYDWATAQRQVDHFSGSSHKKFETLADAKDFMKKGGVLKPKLFDANNKTKLHPNATVASSNKAATTVTSPTTPSEPSVTFNDTDIAFNYPKPTANSTIHSPTESTNSNNCSGCSMLLPLLQSIAERVSKLETSHSSVTSDRIANVESMVTLLSTNIKSIDFKIAEISAKLAASSPPFRKSQQELNQPVNPPAHPFFQRKRSDVNILHPESGHTTTSPTPSNQLQPPASNTSIRTSKDQPSSTKVRNENSFQFNPKKCIVISSTNTDKSHLTSTDQDTIRKLISANHGPLIIDSIRRYRFQSDNPRFMVQFGSTDDVHKIIASWKPGALGGTAVRGTILPSEIPAGMMRGVPLDLSPNAIEKAISDKYCNATCHRLKRNDSQLRTVKVTFANKDDLADAISNGIIIPDFNMRFRLELPYSTNKDTL